MQENGATTQPPAVNETALAAMRELLVEDFPLVLETYLSTSGENFHGLASALASGDQVELRRHAHSLKSSCQHVGAERLSAMAAELERRIHAGELEQREERVAAILREGERVKRHLEQVYNQL